MSTSIDILKYATLADAGYKQGLTPIGWEIVKTSSVSSTGFAATAFRNNETGEIVISYRGTDGFSDLTGSDLALALQKTPEQYIDAQKFYDDIKIEYGDSNLTIVGHSLGGALAQLVGAVTKQQAYSFNGPGVEDIYYSLPDSDSSALAISFTNVNNYNMAFDGVSTLGTQLGSVTNYDPSSLEGLTIFASIAATVANPLVGSIIFGKTIIGQHYIDRLQEAIATPKSTEYINGYIFNEQTGEWGFYDPGTESYKIADEQTTISLNTQLQENYEYNALALQANKLLTEYRGWQTATEQLRAQYGQIWTDFDPSFDGNTGWFQDAQGNYIAEFEIVEENGQNLLKVLGENGQTVNLDTGDVSGKGTLFYDLNSGLQNFVDGFSRNEIVQGVANYGPSLIDALSLVKAIQSGEPLPIVTSGLRLANDLSILNNNPNYVLSGAANAASGVLSIMSLDAALKRGDTLGAISAGAQTISFAATSYAQFATGSSLLKAGELSKEMTNVYGATVGETLNTLNTAIPYLSLAVAIQQGDEVGAALATLAIVQPQIGVPLMIAYAIYSIVDSLFGGDDIPDPWGSGRYVWDGTSIKVQSAGETGGNEAVSGVMQSVITAMNSLIEQQRQTNPTSSLGIIANRMPTVAYDMSGYRYTDIDPLTGVELHPSLRFDTSGNPYNATPGSTESYRSIGEAIIRSALEREAIAPMWEVQTAKMQTDAGDPKAGLTEEARAGRDGQLAPEVTGDTQTFRPVTLDLSGNNQIDIISKATSGISFDVDDSGYMKETAWVGGGDAFLTLDRDYNGETNSGREMFSNSTVALGRRGLAGMGWVNNFVEIRRVV